MHDETLRFLDGEAAPAVHPAVHPAPGADNPGDETPEAAPAARAAQVRRRPRWPGILSAAFGVLTAVLTGVGISVATEGGFAVATAIAWTAIAVSAVGAALGIAAIAVPLGRRWGIAGALLCALANPVILTALLGAAAGLA